MSGDRGDLECVGSEILKYLQLRPRAGDTLEGILEWWLPRIRLEESIDTVQQALDLLERQGLVERVHIGAERVLYRRLDTPPGGSHV
jgi:Fe2+ or Zn2+ uptake regulation protein